MKRINRWRAGLLRLLALSAIVTCLAWACGFDASLREYLTVNFWLPFSKNPAQFEREGVTRIDAPFAGMTTETGDSSLDRLRDAYRAISQPMNTPFETGELEALVAEARQDESLTAHDHEEATLIDAKIDLRLGGPSDPEPLRSAQAKLERFLESATVPAFQSEARGWLARTHYLLGEQAEAGKIYLDELNRDGSNLSRQTLLNSLSYTYGSDGGPQLLAELDQYFDTPEHAAFAIQLLTNPSNYTPGQTRNPEADARVMALLEQHAELLQSETGANALALLTMRVALRMGDLQQAQEIAAMVPADSPVRTEPDYQWMLGSAHFLARDYAGAEQPLLALFRSPDASDKQKAAAAYGLVGVYQKIGDPVEGLRFALELRSIGEDTGNLYSPDLSVYWAGSGWDLNLLLEAEAPIEALRAFLSQYPNARDVRMVKYALAVRLSREERYDEAAQIYTEIGQPRRAPRLRQLAELDREARRTDLPKQEQLEARFNVAQFLADNPNRIYFNDSLWYGLQRYVFSADQDSRLTLAERDELIAMERQLKDDQEERWRAYQILRAIVDEAGNTDLGHRAARLAIQCLRQIHTDRFGREDEIRAGDIELSLWLKQNA